MACITKPTSHSHIEAFYSKRMYARPRTVVVMSSQWSRKNASIALAYQNCNVMLPIMLKPAAGM